jgi:uncharacterized tellurite resistance protein B-like protein
MKFNWLKNLFSSSKKINKINESKSSINTDLQILELLIEIARIDGQITIGETALIKSFIIKSSTLDLKLIETYIQNTGEKTTLTKNIDSIKFNMSKDEILEIIHELFQLSFIDEEIHLEEERLIYKIADLLRVKRYEIIKIKNRVLNRSI